MGGFRVGAVVFLFAFCLSCGFGGPARRYAARDEFNLDLDTTRDFTVISNASIPCEQFEPILKSLGQSAPYQLQDADKYDLVSSFSIEVSRKYVASTREKAKDNFVNLLPLTSQDIITLTKGQVDQSRLLKETVRKGLALYNLAKQQQELRNVSTVVEMTGPVDEDPSSKNKMSLVLPDERLMAKSSPEEDIQSYNYEYCFERGTPLYGGQYLRLCTICSTTRTMTADYWPRYINEAVCPPTDLQCLVGTAAEGSNGMCQQVMIPINLLKRNPGMCVLTLQNGQTLVAEEWDVTSDMMAVGCECAVKSTSHLARYA